MKKPGFEHKPHNPCDPCRCDCNRPGPDPCSPDFPLPPPIPPVCCVPGYSPSQQMGYVVQRVNDCIDRWNHIQGNCYEAMRRCVGACVANDVYYDCDEVKYESGYSTTDQSAYSIITVKSVDKKGEPIRIKLALAYDNTTNSGLKQSITDVSFVKNANAIITAVDPASANWMGTSMWRGAPITSTPNAGGFVAGFNRHGNLEVFAGDVSIETLCQNQMVDCIGAVTPIVQDGQVTAQAQALTTKGAICAIGWKSSNNDKVFLNCGNASETGLQGITVANILKDMGCTTAVITSIITNASATYSNGMEYLGTFTANPTAWNVPENAAYWYVSKRPEPGWCNDFESSIADLVQRTGANANEIDFLGHRVDEVTETANKAWELAQENADKIANIEAEIDTINQQIESINTEITNIKGDIQEVNAQLDELDEKINQEIIDRTNADAQLKTAIAAETAARTQADSAINARITNIINGTTDIPYVKRVGDTMTGNLNMGANAVILDNAPKANNQAANKGYVDQQVTSVADRIDDIQSGTTDLPYVKKAGDTMTGPLTVSGADNTVTVGRGPTADLEVATKKYVDDAITGGTTPGGDVSKEYVDQQIANVQGQIDGKVSKTGDTMTGNLVMSGAGVTVTLPNAPVNNTDATNKTYVDGKDAAIQDQIDNLTEGTTALPYVKKAGDTMTGDLTMSGDAVIRLDTDGSVYNDDTATVVKSEANGVTLMGNSVKVQTEGGASVKIENVANGAVTNDAVNYGQLSEVAGRVTNIENGTTDLPAYVKKAGDTMTGPLVLPADPTENLQAATKQYVDSKAGGGGSEIAPWLPNATSLNLTVLRNPTQINLINTQRVGVCAERPNYIFVYKMNLGNITVYNQSDLSVAKTITTTPIVSICFDQNGNIVMQSNSSTYFSIDVDSGIVTQVVTVGEFGMSAGLIMSKNGWNCSYYQYFQATINGQTVTFNPVTTSTITYCLFGFYDNKFYISRRDQKSLIEIDNGPNVIGYFGTPSENSLYGSYIYNNPDSNYGYGVGFNNDGDYARYQGAAILAFKRCCIDNTIGGTFRGLFGLSNTRYLFTTSPGGAENPILAVGNY